MNQIYQRYEGEKARLRKAFIWEPSLRTCLCTNFSKITVLAKIYSQRSNIEINDVKITLRATIANGSKKILSKNCFLYNTMSYLYV